MYETLQKLLEKPVRTSPRALFLAGPPGSGKSTVGKQVAGGSSAKLVDIDHIVEFLASKRGADFKDREASDQLYTHARDKNLARRNYYITQKHDIIIDGTGRSPQGIARVKRELEESGYETGMLFVAVGLETSISRNNARERRLDNKFVEEAWHDIMRLVRQYDMMFVNFFYVRNEESSQHPQSESSVARHKASQFISR